MVSDGRIVISSLALRSGSVTAGCKSGNEEGMDMWAVSLTALFAGFLLGMLLMVFLVGAVGLGS